MVLKNSSAKIKRIRWISVVLFAVFIILLPLFGRIIPRALALLYWKTDVLYVLHLITPQAYKFFDAFQHAVDMAGLYLIVFAILSFPFFSGYMMYCFGKTKTQSLHLYDKELVYGYYNKTDMADAKIREFYTTYISSAASYRVTNRYIYIYGVFRQDVTGWMNYDKKVKRVKIIRILEDEEERKMLRFLDGIIAAEEAAK